MPVTQQQIQAAQAAQRAAARDPSPQVRLVAGPGSGKSFTIEDRVAWLLQNNTQADRLFAISFTNASAQDLKFRITQYCQTQGQLGEQVSVTTMHSLAMRMLRSAGLLQRFPAAPMVLDHWEVRNIFIEEFCRPLGMNVSRADQVRRDREAFWSTGNYNPPNYIPPTPAITSQERDRLSDFLTRFEQVYSCILPGEIVRECVDQIRAGVIIPTDLVSIDQLIVDEYQDLNPIDLEFIDSIISSGTVGFVAGDDDQSIYSFRFALPHGIQRFPQTYQNSGDHTLSHCFRCTTSVLAAAQAVLTAHPSANRIPKHLQSVYLTSNPPLPGHVMRWIFRNGADEARGIATSCRALVDAGMSPQDILILISDRNLLERGIRNALEAQQVPVDLDTDYLSTEDGRVIYAIMRIISNEDDYLAHRTLLGFLPNVGLNTCIEIKQKVGTNNLNYRNLFYQPLPTGVFTQRETTVIWRLADVCSRLSQLDETETLGNSRAELASVAQAFGVDFDSSLSSFLPVLSDALTLSELRELMTASDDQKVSILTEAFQRAGGSPPPAIAPVSRVKVMTMHGSKGLSARVVFVPGLEEQVFPGPRRRPYPGLIEEAARLLYVSITRARAGCILSYAQRRVVHGRFTTHHPSRFNQATGGPFIQQLGSLTPNIAARIVADCALL
jgi:superfamily I DNA/RNA helicase